MEPSKRQVTLELAVVMGAVRLIYADGFVRAHAEYIVSAGDPLASSNQGFVRTRAVDFPVTGKATLDEVRAIAMAQVNLAEGLNG